jgi:hypothetical protein
MTVRAMMVPLGLALTLGCKSSSSRASAQALPSDAPVISMVRPDSGPAGTAYPIEVTIEGRDFADSANIVAFGPVTIRDVPSRASRTRIVMYLPKEIPSSGEVPPAPLPPGSYEIRVTTPAGPSNTVTFRLLAGSQ